MTSSYIQDLADGLIKKHGTRNPFKLCRELGIEVVYDDLGSLKGIYTVLFDTKYILINQALNTPMRKIVCAHELGHDQLHHDFAEDKMIKEIMVYDMKSRPEYEANLFASHILLDEKNVYRYVKQGFDVQQIAGILNTDVNIVLLKINEMIRGGYDLYAPGTPKSNFLK